MQSLQVCTIRLGLLLSPDSVLFYPSHLPSFSPVLVPLFLLSLLSVSTKGEQLHNNSRRDSLTLTLHMTGSAREPTMWESQVWTLSASPKNTMEMKQGALVVTGNCEISHLREELTRVPELWQCAVTAVGVYSLSTLTWIFMIKDLGEARIVWDFKAPNWAYEYGCWILDNFIVWTSTPEKKKIRVIMGFFCYNFKCVADHNFTPTATET